MRYVIALGGNALLQRGEAPEAGAQEAHARAAAAAIAPVAERHQVVICHGNGPQVGLLADESSTDAELTRPYPLDALGAETQGLIGYWLVRELAGAGLRKPVAALVTQTAVDIDDAAFTHPTKFIGPSWTHRHAVTVAARHGWQIGADGQRWRRVVPSPDPRDVIELPLITTLLDSGAIVVCGGGGGVPVSTQTPRRGVDAVIDKDLTASLLARALDADRLIILTDVPNVERDYGTPHAESIEQLALQDLASLALPAGSMGPKIEACRRFVAATGRSAVIGSLSQAVDVLAGNAGTVITAAASVNTATATSRTAP